MTDMPQRRYRWGNFQGVAAILIGLMLFTDFVQDPYPLAGRVSRLEVLDASLSLTAYSITGIGLLAKWRLGFVMVYVWIVRAVVGQVVSLRLFGNGHDTFWISHFVMLCWWGIPGLFYYPKRFREFGFGARKTASETTRLAAAARSGSDSSSDSAVDSSCQE